MVCVVWTTANPLLAIALVIGVGRFHACREVDVAPGAHDQLLVRRDVRRPRVDVLAGDQRQVAAGRDVGADFPAAAGFMTIARAARDAIAVAFGERIQDDVPPGLQARIVRPPARRSASDRGRPAWRLPASTRATPVRYAPAAAVILRRRGRRQRDIASGAQDDLAALDRRDQIAQISRGQVNAAALNSAAGLVDDIAGGDDRGLARADGAAVGRIAVHGNIDTAARQQRAVALQVARAPADRPAEPARFRWCRRAGSRSVRPARPGRWSAGAAVLRSARRRA